MVCVICVLGLFIFYSALCQGGMMALGRKSKKSCFMPILFVVVVVVKTT